MDTIHIINSPLPVLYGVNFSKKEFWSPPKPPTRLDFDLYSCIPLALQVFRDYFSKLYGKEIKWLVTSCYRPNDPLTMPDAHRICPPACDSVPLDRILWQEIQNKIRNELKRWENSDLIKSVLVTGCNVIIIEPTCLHIHQRNHNLDYPKGYVTGIYLGEWSRKNGKGINISYSRK